MLDAADVDAMTKTLSEAIEKTIPAVVDELSSALLKRVKREATEGLLARDYERIEFERRLLQRWRKPLTSFALEIELAVEMGSLANQWLRKHRRSERTAVIEAITRIHARACQIAGEVQALLRSGFADGAMARWRTLHELNVVSWLLLENGETLAERYLLHLDIDSLRAANKFQRSAPALGYRLIPDREIKRLERRRAALVRRFGKSFREEYGWAADVTRNPNPKFNHIEEATAFSRLQPYYKLASGNVHAGPKGAFFRLGLLPTAQQVLLTGPSNAGLDEAGRLAALSLAQITVALLQIKTTLDGLVWSKALLELAGEVETAFIKVQRKLERENRARQNGQAKKKPVGKAKKG